MSTQARQLRADQRSGGRQHSARRALAACVFTLLAACLFAPRLGAQTPAGTEIRAAAEATYETENGVTLRAVSDTLVLVVGQVAGVDLEGSQSLVGTPGSTILFAHTLTNIGNGVDSVLVTAESQRGWPTGIVFAEPGDGGASGLTPVTAGPVVLSPGSTIGVLVSVTIPSWETLSGPADTISVVATSQFDPTQTDALYDYVAIVDAGISVSLEKQVDRATATVGDVLTYTIEYHAVGPNSATDFRIIDPIPDGTRYVPGTLLLNGVPLTDASGDDVGAFEAESDRVAFYIGSLQGGDTGVVSFQVRVED